MSKSKPKFLLHVQDDSRVSVSGYVSVRDTYGNFARCYLSRVSYRLGSHYVWGFRKGGDYVLCADPR